MQLSLSLSLFIPPFSFFLLQKVIRQSIPISSLIASLLCILMHVILRSRSKDIEEALATIADLEHAGHVAASIAIVGGAPYRAQSVVVEDLESLLTELVGAEDMGHVVDGQEFLHHLGSKGVAGAAGGEGEFVSVGVGVGPDEIGHGAFVGDLAESVYDFDLVYGVD